MARGRSIIVGGGVGASAPFTTGRIPVIVNNDPASIGDSIMRQVAPAGVMAIIVGVTDPSPAATEKLRTAAGLISTGVGTDSVRLGRAITVNGVDSIGVGRTISDGATTSMIALGTDISQSAASNIMYGRTITAGGNSGILIGASITTGGAANNCTIIGTSITVGAAVTNVVCLFAPANVAGNFLPAAGMTYIGHASGGFVVIGTGDNNTGSRQCRLRANDLTNGPANNTPGNDLLVSSGIGTGNAVGTSLIFQTATPGVSGGALQLRETRLTLTSLAAAFTVPVTVAAVVAAGSPQVTVTANAGTDPSVRFNAFTNGAAAQVGTLNNAPAAGNPAFWLRVNIAGTDRFIPCW